MWKVTCSTCASTLLAFATVAEPLVLPPPIQSPQSTVPPGTLTFNPPPPPLGGQVTRAERPPGLLPVMGRLLSSPDSGWLCFSHGAALHRHSAHLHPAPLPPSLHSLCMTPSTAVFRRCTSSSEKGGLVSPRFPGGFGWWWWGGLATLGRISWLFPRVSSQQPFL